MRSLIFFSLSLILVNASVQAQEKDTVRRLEEVLIKAYAYEKPLTDVPAAIGVINTKALNRFATTSLLPALNTVPGVRMEERSPGSYRLSIRGSTLRSPFGVRNVKVYWNFLPLTDGGGNTYLNSLDFNSVNTIEIIKGPGASLYGAGTGGVLLLNNQLKKETTINLHFLTGSYGLIRYSGYAQLFTEKTTWKVLVAEQHSKGYREHTAMSRLAAQVEGNISIGKKSTLSTLLFSSDLKYETPGGLTKEQYEFDPRQARPATATQPGAREQQAAVNNKTIYTGLVYEIKWNEAWSTRTGVYGSYNDFKNPAIRNYEERWETNAGNRTEIQYRFEKNKWQGKITFGGEFQSFYSPVKVYDNDKGVPAQIQVNDKLATQLFFGFAQAEVYLPKEFYLTIGSSSNFLKYHFERSVPVSAIQNRKFNNQISPRIALLKKLRPSLSAYSNVSYGFSPPSLSEVRPSTNNFNEQLNPEQGINYETGLKGEVLKHFSFDLAVYYFKLKETIIIQRTNDGAEYFINSGNTSQRGIEINLTWEPFLKNKSMLSSFILWGSYSLNDYHFKKYTNDGENYSGNLLTGTSPHVVTAGADITLKKFYGNLTFNYTDHTPLNDANSEFASDYYLMGIRTGYKTTFLRKLPVEIFVGADNLLDERYSLGNDLNATGSRFYNVAAGRNFYGGVSVNLLPHAKRI